MKKDRPQQFTKNVDLHESEWAKDGKKQPILGTNGALFLIVFASSFPIGYFCKWYFTFSKETFGFWPGLAIAGLFSIFFIQVCVGPIVSAAFALADWIQSKLPRR